MKKIKLPESAFHQVLLALFLSATIFPFILYGGIYGDDYQMIHATFNSDTFSYSEPFVRTSTFKWISPHLERPVFNILHSLQELIAQDNILFHHLTLLAMYAGMIYVIFFWLSQKTNSSITAAMAAILVVLFPVDSSIYMFAYSQSFFTTIFAIAALYFIDVKRWNKVGIGFFAASLLTYESFAFSVPLALFLLGHRWQALVTFGLACLRYGIIILMLTRTKILWWGPSSMDTSLSHLFEESFNVFYTVFWGPIKLLIDDLPRLVGLDWKYWAVSLILGAAATWMILRKDSGETNLQTSKYVTWKVALGLLAVIFAAYIPFLPKSTTLLGFLNDTVESRYHQSGRTFIVLFYFITAALIFKGLTRNRIVPLRYLRAFRIFCYVGIGIFVMVWQMQRFLLQNDHIDSWKYQTKMVRDMVSWDFAINPGSLIYLADADQARSGRVWGMGWYAPLPFRWYFPGVTVFIMPWGHPPDVNWFSEDRVYVFPRQQYDYGRNFGIIKQIDGRWQLINKDFSKYLPPKNFGPGVMNLKSSDDIYLRPKPEMNDSLIRFYFQTL